MLPDCFSKGDSLLGLAAVDGMDGVGGLVREWVWWNDLFSSDVLRQFGHLVQVVELLGYRSFKP